MKNAEWMIKNGMEFSRLTWAHINGRNIIYYRYRKNKSIAIEIYSEKSVNSENLITKWLDMEHKEQVLDDAEKRYLSAVIRPFRNYIQSISKAKIAYCEWLHFELTYDSFSLPLFKPGEMYKGMEPGKKYSLEELGL